MVDFLLRRGADVEHKTDEMHTALMEAAMDGHVSVAKRLIESGAKVMPFPSSVCMLKQLPLAESLIDWKSELFLL